MKKHFFLKMFLIYYLIFTLIFVYFFGNLNFFGETGFHFEFNDLITILVLWSWWPALIVTFIGWLIAKLYDSKAKK